MTLRTLLIAAVVAAAPVAAAAVTRIDVDVNVPDAFLAGPDPATSFTFADPVTLRGFFTIDDSVALAGGGFAGMPPGLENDLELTLTLPGVETIMFDETNASVISLILTSGPKPVTEVTIVGDLNSASAGFTPVLGEGPDFVFRINPTFLFVPSNGNVRGNETTGRTQSFVVTDIAPIPLPEAAWMLLAGLGALGVAARRRG